MEAFSSSFLFLLSPHQNYLYCHISINSPFREISAFFGIHPKLFQHLLITPFPSHFHIFRYMLHSSPHLYTNISLSSGCHNKNIMDWVA